MQSTSKYYAKMRRNRDEAKREIGKKGEIEQTFEIFASWRTCEWANVLMIFSKASCEPSTPSILRLHARTLSSRRLWRSCAFRPRWCPQSSRLTRCGNTCSTCSRTPFPGKRHSCQSMQGLRFIRALRSSIRTPKSNMHFYETWPPHSRFSLFDPAFSFIVVCVPLPCFITTLVRSIPRCARFSSLWKIEILLLWALGPWPCLLCPSHFSKKKTSKWFWLTWKFILDHAWDQKLKFKISEKKSKRWKKFVPKFFSNFFLMIF